MGDAMLLMDVLICLKGADCDCILQEGEEECVEFEILVLYWLLSSKITYLLKKYSMFFFFQIQVRQPFR